MPFFLKTNDLRKNRNSTIVRLNSIVFHRLKAVLSSNSSGKTRFIPVFRGLYEKAQMGFSIFGGSVFLVSKDDSVYTDTEAIMYKRMLGETIYRLRKEKGLSQDELGKLVGVSNKAVSKWETYEANPDITLLPLLAQALGVTTDELLFGAISIGFLSYGAVSVGYYAHTIKDRGYAIGKHIFFH